MLGGTWVSILLWHFNVAAASTAADELAVSADDVDRVVACPGPDGVGLPSWTAVEHPTSSPLLISTAISGLNTSPESHAAAPAARTEGRRPGTRRALGVHTRQLWSAGSIGAGHQPAASPPTAKATVRLRIRYWQRRPSRRPLPSVHRWPFAPRDRRPCDSGISCRRPVLLRRDDGTHFPQATATCSLPIGTKEALQNRRIVRGLRLLAGRLQAENLQDAVALRQATFEDVAPDEGPFGVVVAAQSFHWTDPETRWSRLASLLGKDGVAFLFWNGWQLDPTHHDLEGVRQVYRRDGGTLVPGIDDHRGETNWAEDEIATEPLLGGWC